MADGCRGAATARRSSSSTALASSKGSMTAWASDPTHISIPAARKAAVGPIPSASSRSVVGQMQQRDPLAEIRSMSPAVTWVAWTAVNLSPKAPAASNTPIGVCRRRGGTRRSRALARRRGHGAPVRVQLPTWRRPGSTPGRPPGRSARRPRCDIGRRRRVSWLASAQASADPSLNRACTSFNPRPTPPWR